MADIGERRGQVVAGADVLDSELDLGEPAVAVNGENLQVRC